MSSDLIADLLRNGHAVEFPVRGDSMHPFIREGDVLHVVPAGEVRVGDVVLVSLERGLTAHRVVALRDSSVVTRGDNAAGPDAPVERAGVLGVVQAVQRGGKRATARRNVAWVAVVRWLRRMMRRQS